MRTRVLLLGLVSGTGAWGGWSLGVRWGIVPGFLLANLGIALGWYYGRRYVREFLD